MNYTKSTLQKIEKIFEEQNYTIRYEKGNFQSGYCIVRQSRIVVINKYFDIKGRINVLLDILSGILIMEPLLTPRSKKFFKYLLKEQEKSLTSVINS